MKNSFLFLPFLFMANLSFGQIEWVGNHEFSENPSKLFRNSQDQEILVHGGGLTVFDSLGNLVFEEDLQSIAISDVVELSDSSILFFASFYGCDILVSSILKYDKNWVMEQDNSNFYEAELLAYVNDSTLIASYHGSESISKLNLNNHANAVWETHLGAGNEVRSIMANNHDSIFVATAGGLAVLNMDGVLDTIIASLKFDKIKRISTGGFIGQYGDSLALYASDIEPLAFFSAQGHTIRDFVAAENKVWVLTEDAKVYQLTGSLQILTEFQPLLQNQSASLISPFGNGIVLAGSEGFGVLPKGNSATFIKSYQPNGGNLETNEDVGIQQISLGSEPTLAYNKTYSFVFVPFGVGLNDIKVEIKNYGENTLHSVNLNLAFPIFPVPDWCPVDQRFTKAFDNLNLLPGETTTLTWDHQDIYFYADPSGQLDLCLWTSLPNHHLETNNDNDVACTQVTVATQERFPVAFDHYFNPVADELNIALQEQLGSGQAVARVFNATGQLVHSEALVSQQQSLELGHLPDGAYFLQIVAGQRVGWAKFAKY